MKKRLVLMLCLVMLFTTFSVPVFAADKGSNGKGGNGVLKASVEISDPETGDTWKWDIQESDIHRKSSKDSSLSTVSALSNTDGQAVEGQEISIDLGKYLAATQIPISTTCTDDITLTAGMYYSADAAHNSVSVYSVFGSTTPQGLYYATNRKFYWRNPGAGVGGQYAPYDNSWSYLTDSTAGAYSTSAPPYSLLDCEVHVSGMTAYRNVSVKCTLNDL